MYLRIAWNRSPDFARNNTCWRVESMLGRRFLGTIVARKRPRPVHKMVRNVAPGARLLRHRNPAAF